MNHAFFKFTQIPEQAAVFSNPMKTIPSAFLALVLLILPGAADDKTPPANMIEHAKWARETKELPAKIERLEGFMRAYLPSEEGGSNPKMVGYGDGSHGLAVAGCAWELARAYVEAGQKEKALKMLDWLQQYDSKSKLFPGKAKEEGDKASPPKAGG